MKMISDKMCGLLLGIIGSITYGMNPLFTLPLYKVGFSPDAVLFFRYFSAVFMVGAWMIYKHESFRIKGSEWFLFPCAGVIYAVSSLALFASYRKMDAGIASTLLFVYPVLTALIMRLFFKEKLSRITWLSVILSMIGIGLLYRSADGAVLNTAGVLLVFSSATTYALYLVGVNRTKLQTASVWSLSFYVLFFGSIFYLIRILCGCASFGSYSTNVVFNFLMLALFPTLISLLATTLAIHRVGATVTAILGALEPLTAVFIGVIVFHEAFTVRIAAGIFLILTAVILIVLSKRRIVR